MTHLTILQMNAGARRHNKGPILLRSTWVVCSYCLCLCHKWWCKEPPTPAENHFCQDWGSTMATVTKCAPEGALLTGSCQQCSRSGRGRRVFQDGGRVGAGKGLAVTLTTGSNLQVKPYRLTWRSSLLHQLKSWAGVS